MKVLNFFDTPIHISTPSVTLGVFDGVHRGHQKLLSLVKNSAKKNGGETIVITFNEHPLKLLKGQSPPSIVSLDMKLALLEKEGAKYCLDIVRISIGYCVYVFSIFLFDSLKSTVPLYPNSELICLNWRVF